MLPIHCVVQCSACAVATPIPSKVARVRQIPRVFRGPRVLCNGGENAAVGAPAGARTAGLSMMWVFPTTYQLKLALKVVRATDHSISGISYGLFGSRERQEFGRPIP